MEVAAAVAAEHAPLHCAHRTGVASSRSHSIPRPSRCEPISGAPLIKETKSLPKPSPRILSRSSGLLGGSIAWCSCMALAGVTVLQSRCRGASRTAPFAKMQVLKLPLQRPEKGPRTCDGLGGHHENRGLQTVLLVLFPRPTQGFGAFRARRDVLLQSSLKSLNLLAVSLGEAGARMLAEGLATAA